MQEAIGKMPEEEAKYHLKRCVDSGLWVPDASKADKAATSGDASTSNDNATASTSDTKPSISTEDID